MAADSTSLAKRHTVNSEADPLYPIPNDGVVEFILKAENWTLVPEIADENGTLRALVDPKYLPRPRAPQAPVVPQVPMPSRLDELYAADFRRLELGLEAQSAHLAASVTDGNVATLGFVRVSAKGEEARSAHLPAFVTEGRVATLGFVRMSAEGEAAFESTLEDHVAAPTK